VQNKIRTYIRQAVSEVINEKSVSQDQQQAAGAALAAKRGDIPVSSLKGASKEMYKMSEKELEKFAKTKHKGLPVKKEALDLSHDEDELEMIKSDLYSIAKDAAELCKLVKNLQSPVDFPHWWQTKIIDAKHNVSAAAEYLEYEIGKQNPVGYTALPETKKKRKC